MKVVPLAVFHHLVNLINQPGISPLTFLVGANVPTTLLSMHSHMHFIFKSS